MWEVRVICAKCEGKHSVFADQETIPRSFSFVCPEKGMEVEMRFRNPTMISRPWTAVEERSPGSIPAKGTQDAGTLDI